jgi:nucleoside-diphosphate-sugar epimerase
MTTIFLTGATGAIGSALAETLACRHHRVICLIRPGGGAATAHSRLSKFASGSLLSAVAGDILRPLCGIASRDIGAADKFVHCAASVQLDSRNAKHTTATNVEGTKNALALAEALGAREFHYVSTAYVSGSASNLDEETDHHCLWGFPRNAYESSKRIGECLVREGAKQFSIYRPSIVVGNACDGSTHSWSGYYGFFREIYRLGMQLRNSSLEEPLSLLSGGGLYLPVTIAAVPTTPLNLVHSDWLASILADLIALPANGRHYNLTNPNPSRVGYIIEESARLLDILGISVAPQLSRRAQRSQISVVERSINLAVKPFRPYISQSTLFTSDNARKDLEGKFRAPEPITLKFLRKTLALAQASWDREDACFKPSVAL